MTEWTIKKLLNWISDYFADKGLDAPRFRGEMLLAHVLDTKRIELYTNFDQPVSASKLDQLRDLVKRASRGEPISYLIGRTEFYSLTLKVTPDCLIPRPETELLVERSIELLRHRKGSQLIGELCTGSGCVAVAIAKNFPQANIIAADSSEKALSVAADNVQMHSLADRVKLLRGDLFEPVIAELGERKFDLLVSNPPYVTDEEFENLDPGVKDYEPPTALRGGPDGLGIIRRIINQSADFLKPDGILMLEIGYRQGPQVRKLISDTGLFGNVQIQKDLSGHDRIAIAEMPRSAPSS